jgi:hypothetical protein
MNFEIRFIDFEKYNKIFTFKMYNNPDKNIILGVKL